MDILNWIKKKLSERSTWDGTVLVGVGVVAFIAAPFVKWVAGAAILYGLYRIYEDEYK